MSLFKIAVILSFPFAVLKAFISCVHAYAASLDLAAFDVREREEKRTEADKNKKET